jgi:hypothetical protein
MEMETTLGSQHVVSQRVFRIDKENFRLMPLGFHSKEAWNPGVNVSKCGVARGHEGLKPAANCTCGFWACKSRKSLHQAIPPHAWAWNPKHLVVSAQVEQWGVVIEHEGGYRSEYARIIPETIQVYPRPRRPRHVKLIKKLREVYAV